MGIKMALIIKCNKLTTRDHHSLPNNQRKVVTIKNQPFWQSVDHRAPLSVNPVQFNIGCSTGWSLWALVVGKPTHVSEGHSMTQVGWGGGERLGGVATNCNSHSDLRSYINVTKNLVISLKQERMK